MPETLPFSRTAIPDEPQERENSRWKTQKAFIPSPWIMKLRVKQALFGPTGLHMGGPGSSGGEPEKKSLMVLIRGR
ncbi:MAG: hypothetical protein OEY86_13575 [Nitrospira sp.]|nr:hypothetical protein [Nitrospira sp.]